MKTLLKVGALVMLLIVVALAALGFYLDAIIKAGVETVGPKITGTTMKLDAVDLSPFSGQGRLKGLVVGNPQGFHTENSFKLADSKVSVDLKSALSDKLIIKEILIDGPEVTYESGPSGNNITKIQENVAAFAKSVTPQDTAAPKPQKKDSTQKKIQINDFIFKNGKATVSSSMLQGKPLTISLPDIHLRDIGKEAGGVTPETAAAEVFKAINKAVLQSVSKGAEEAVKSIGKGAGEAGSKAVEGVKGLFGK
jgi:hypothetical protein